MSREKVLALLTEKRGAALSGEAMSRELGISRAAVWKAVEALRQEGYVIASAPNRGYCLQSAPDRLREGELSGPLTDCHLGHPLLCFECIDSTNTECKRRAMAGAPDGLVAVSEEQTGGMGRKGRAFLSPKGKGLYLSNDLVLNGKKLCGILTEIALEGESHALDYLVPGIGINVSQTPEDFGPELAATATSLSYELGRPVRRADLAVQVIKALDRMYAGFPRNRQEYLDKYRADCLTPGNQVQLVTPNSRREAFAVEIDDQFRLVVEFPDGTRQALSAGEVSVRGMYGYV